MDKMNNDLIIDKKLLKMSHIKTLNQEEAKKFSEELLLLIISEKSIGNIKKPMKKQYRKAYARILTFQNLTNRKNKNVKN